MKKLKCVVIILFSVILLCACAGAGIENSVDNTNSSQEVNEINVAISSDEKMLDQLVTRTYSDEELDEIVKLRLSSIEELNGAYPIECFRTLSYGVYRAVYAGENRVVIMEFDKTGLCYAGINYELKNTKNDFDNLKIGDTLDTVMEADPYGDYSFLNFSNGNIAKMSTHCTLDGYYITILYGGSDDMQHFIVKGILFEYI